MGILFSCGKHVFSVGAFKHKSCGKDVFSGGASEDESCRKDVLSVGASKNKLSHAGRICLAGGPSRMQEGCV